jgi:hypothetical protein
MSKVIMTTVSLTPTAATGLDNIKKLNDMRALSI